MNSDNTELPGLSEPKDLANAIRSVRSLLNLTQAQLAVRIKVALPSIYRYESAKSVPTPSTLKSLYDLAVQVDNAEAVYVIGRELARRTGTDSETTPPSNIPLAPKKHGGLLTESHRKSASNIDVGRPVSDRLPWERSRPRGQQTQHLLISIVPEAEKGLTSYVPSDILAFLSEARVCLQLHLFAASLMLSHQAIATAMKPKLPIKDRPSLNTLNGIHKLRHYNIIEERIAEWGVLILGICAKVYHGLDQTSAQDAQDVFTFADRLCDCLYVLPAQFDEFTRRRSTRKAKQ